MSRKPDQTQLILAAMRMLRISVFSALILSGLVQPALAQSVIINEVDADQVSTDSAEFVELFDGGGGNTDLSGMSLVFYNGSDDQSYLAFDLDGQTTDAMGYFVLCGDAANVANCDLDVAPNTNLIQNGADAVALVTGDAVDFPNDTPLTTVGLIDAIVYDTDDSDDAGILVLLNAGQPQVNERGGGDGTGHSNQRCPNGAGGARNTSTYLQADPTPGVANLCGGEPPEPAEPEVVINEIDYDQESTDTAEFIELKNVGSVDADLGDFSLQLINGTGGGGTVYDVIALPSTMLTPGSYFVICANASMTANCDLDVTPNTNLVQNGSPDAVALWMNGAVMDAVSYEGNVIPPFVEGSGVGLEDVSSTAFAGISRFPDGIDTDLNNIDLSLRCITPGSENTASLENCPDPLDVPELPEIVINEVDADQVSTDSAEFVELFDGGTGNTDLSGLSLVLYNGSDDRSYLAFDLDGHSTNAMGYFVLCGDAGNVANCDLDVTPNTNLIQNGADAVALISGDAVNFPNDTPVTTVNLIDAIVYGTDDSDDAGLLVLLNAGQPQVNERGGGDGTGHSNQRCDNGTGGARNTDTYAQFTPTPGTENVCGSSPVVEAEIFEIQGSGLASPFAGQTVLTQNNVVTAVGPNGFAMQTPTSRSDEDVDTSDGIYVFTGGAPTVAVGDLVDVTGNVVEFFDFTEFTGSPAVTIVGAGGALPAPIIFDAATPSPDPAAPSCAIEYECYEGMLVQMDNGTVTGPNQGFGSDPIAEFYITAGAERTFRGPGLEFPGMAGIPVWDGNPEVFELDADKLGLPNVLVTPGTKFSAVGVIGYEFGGYELWASSLTVHAIAPIPGPVRDRAPKESTIGSLNLFRLFDDVDDPPGMNVFGETTNDTVVSSDEYQRRLHKLARYIGENMKLPDVIGVQEVESLQVLEDLAAKINALNPGAGYQAYLVEGNDIGSIDVGFLVRAANVNVSRVLQLGADETYVNPEDGVLDILHDRPPLVLQARFGPSFYPMNVMVVHNRSLGGINTERVQVKRFEQAQSIARMVDDLQGSRSLLPTVVIGDFNAFEFSDGYVDTVGHIRGVFNPADSLLSGPDLVEPDLMNQVLALPEEERYSFIFRGNSQVLDHALTNLPLDLRIRGMEYARGNVDAAADLIHDDSTVLRSSDHDGFVLYINTESAKKKRGRR